MNRKYFLTPADEGFYMPAEFTGHDRCWMAWPTNKEVFPGRLEAARKAYTQVAHAIAEFEPVTMVANPKDAGKAAKRLGKEVEVLPIEINDSWTRDTAPTFIINDRGEAAGVDWFFNGWGEASTNYENDAQLAERILEHLDLKHVQAGLVLEGGAIHVDGEGSLMAIIPCLTDRKRNPGLKIEDLERFLSGLLGVRHFLWLDHGLEDDITLGHIDNVACFARPGVVLVNGVSDQNDANYTGAQENIAKLRSSKDADGRILEVIEIEQPARREGKKGRMTLSYINFYLPEGGVVMPAFDDPRDENALQILKSVFPERKVVQIPALDIVFGGGGIHCITQQQPKPVSKW